MKLTREDTARAQPVRPVRMSPLPDDVSPARLSDNSQSLPGRTPSAHQQPNSPTVRTGRARARPARRRPKRMGRSAGRMGKKAAPRRMRSKRRPRRARRPAKPSSM